MKKISSTNILTKIFKKNPVKKTKNLISKISTKIKKKVKAKVKVTKKNLSTKKLKENKKGKKFLVKVKKDLKSKKNIKNETSGKIEVKTNNLRISKSNEVKPEIKKVKKQETEKREYKVKDYVVYPKHGVGQITEFKKGHKKFAPEKVEVTNNLRISKSNEIKPEIKKVKRQETEKREYKVKDYVVYPKHGVGQITEYKKINIGGIDIETYVLKFEKDKANGMVPVNKQSHLRPLATINQVNKCITILKGKPKIKRSMWSRRAQEYEAKISSGKIYELAEVVRDLNKGDDLLVDQSYSERQLFEKAYERVLSEFQIVLGVSMEDTQKKLDKALKRNLEGQANAIAVPVKPVEPVASEAEPTTDTED